MEGPLHCSCPAHLTYCLPLTRWAFYQAHLRLPGLGPATLHMAVGHSDIYTVQAKHTVVERDGHGKEVNSELLQTVLTKPLI